MKKYLTKVIAGLLIAGGLALTVSQLPHSNLSPSSRPPQVLYSQSMADSPTNLADLQGQRLTDLPLPAIGAISIPELSIHLPIFEGDQEKQLHYGAGTVMASSFGADNLSLSSHQVFTSSGSSSDWLFSPLTNIGKGQIVFVADEHNIYQYRITESFIVDRRDVHVTAPVPGQKLITLIYCTDPDSDRRTIVRGDFISEKPISEADPEILGHFRSSWNQLPEEVTLT
jgi:LPXTG-site transpeptidase (sortase) family protein